MLYVCRDSKGLSLELVRDGHERKTAVLPGVRDAGQIARLDGPSLLVADPVSGTIWRADWREVPDQPQALSATVVPWRRDLPGVIGLQVTPDAAFAASPMAS